MNKLAIAAVATIALVGTGAWAQELTPQQAEIQAAQTPGMPSGAQDVGGVSPAVGGGAPQGATRQQVTHDLIQSEKSGELQMIQNSVYRGQ